MQSETNFQKSILLNTFRKFYRDKITCRVEKTALAMSCHRKATSTGILHLIQNRCEIHGTWFYLPAMTRHLASTKWKHLTIPKGLCTFQRELIPTTVHTQKWPPSNDSTYIEGKHCLSSVKPSGPFTRSGTFCFIFHRNPDHHDVMKYYRSRLHVRLLVDALLVANLYVEMCSITWWLLMYTHDKRPI